MQVDDTARYRDTGSETMTSEIAGSRELTNDWFQPARLMLTDDSQPMLRAPAEPGTRITVTARPIATALTAPSYGHWGSRHRT